MEERFCSKVKELGCTCITISHRPALVAFHDLVLALDGEGGWSIHEGATGSFTEETIPEEGAVVTGNGGMQMSGGQGTSNKARTKDAAAVLEGMRVSLSVLLYNTLPPTAPCQHCHSNVFSAWSVLLLS